MQVKVSIIIVSWNVKAELSACIDSIVKNVKPGSYEIIVVDNASADGTVAHLRGNCSEVKVIANNLNVGFGRANNQAAVEATGEYFFILNPDTLVLPGTIDSLVYYMDSHAECALCGPRVLNEDGSVQSSVKNFPNWKGAFCRYTPLKYLGIFKSDLNKWRYRDFNYEKESDVEQLIGAALLIRKNVFQKLNGFDEQFFMYYEEVDLCRRISLMGLKNIFYPGAELIHLGGRSSNQVLAKKKFMMLQSLISYLKKNNNSAWVLVLIPLFKLGILSLQFIELLVHFLGSFVSILLFNKKRGAKCKKRYKNAFRFINKYALPLIKI